MPRKSRLQVTMIALLIGVGLVPLVYFATVNIERVSAAGEAAVLQAEPLDSLDPLDRPVDNVAFGVGEKLSFDIGYGFINAGTASMEVLRMIEYENRPSYQIVTRAQSNGFFSTFYKVDDRVESIIDAAGLFSWRFEKHLSEGSYRAVREYELDQRQHWAITGADTLDVPPFVQDPLSVLYYLRTQQLEVGQSVYMDNFTDGEIYPLEVRILEKERVNVKAGTFDCIVVEPLLQSVGVFKHEGSLKVWLTDDRLKMPVLMKSKVLVGSITAELTDYELGDLDAF